MIAGRFGAVSASRRASRTGNRRNDAAARARLERKKAEETISKIMSKYDKDGSGKLEKDQVIQLLTDLDHSTPQGTKPTEEEVTFVLQCADKSRNKAIDREELVEAIAVWNSYICEKATIDEVMSKYDKDNTGSLSKDELKSLLTELNDGCPVTDEEVGRIMKHSDTCTTGDLKRVEVLLAINYWFVLRLFSRKKLQDFNTYYS